MAKTLIDVNQLESILQRYCLEYVDHLQLIKVITSYIRDSSITPLRQEIIPKKELKISIRQVNLTTSPNAAIQLTIDFTIPKDNGVVIGDCVLLWEFSGEITMQDERISFLVSNNV